MKLTREELTQIVVKVCSAKRLSKQQCSILLGMADYNERIVTSEQIAHGLQKIGWPNATRDSVRVQTCAIRYRLKGTGLKMQAFFGAGGGSMLVYDPAP